MSFDLHIGCNPEQAAGRPASASLDLHDHDSLFRKGDLADGDFPLLARMSDYFEDAQFENEELDQLMEEIRTALHRCKEASSMAIQLQKIESVCRQARDRKLNLWVFCD